MVSRARSRRRSARRRNPGLVGTLTKIGIGLLSGILTRGVRYATAKLPITKGYQDLAFGGAMAAGITGAAFVSDALTIGLSAGAGYAGCEIAEYWYADHAAAKTTNADGTAMKALYDVRQAPRGALHAGGVRQAPTRTGVGVAARKSSFG